MGERGGEASVAVLHEGGDMFEIDSRLRIESKNGERCTGIGVDLESCSEMVAKEACNSTEMEPCAASNVMKIIRDFKEGNCVLLQERDLMHENIGLVDCSAKCQTKEVSNNEIETGDLVEIHVKDGASVIESNICSDIQVKEVGISTEIEDCTGIQENETLDEHCIKQLCKQSPHEAHVEPVELIENRKIEPCAQNHAPDVLYDCNLELVDDSNEVKEAVDPKREASNDDIFSEVSNPNQSPKHAISSSTISSQLHDVLVNGHSGCQEITSACSHDSNCNDKMGSGSTSCVVLEIPKHVSTTGIRKITFKLRKREDDHERGQSIVEPMTDDEFQEDEHNNQLSLSDSQPVTNDDGLQNYEWDVLENAGMDLTNDGLQSPFSHTSTREVCKRIISNNYPTNVEKLLATRILEGARVKYISISGEKEIPGIIGDCGYICGCSMCNFTKVVSAFDFELHAGTKTRHPENYIYLENGKPIYSIIQHLNTAPLTALDDVIKAVAGSSLNQDLFQAWKASLPCGNDAAADCAHQGKHYQPIFSYPSRPTEGSHGSGSCYYPQMSPYSQQNYVEPPVQKKRLIKKPRYSFSSSAWDPKKMSKRGAKKRDNDLHKSLFMPNGLPDGTDVAYYSKGKRILGGYKQGNGIVCSCCNTEISPSQFEAHAGCAAKRQPYRNIYTSSGLALHDISLMLASGQNLATSGSDDMCATCGGRGEFILCNGCPRAFHAACLGLLCHPEDDWLCPYCRDEFAPGRKASGKSRHVGVRQTRVVKGPELVTGGCVFCRSQEFSAAKFDDWTMIICDQCEKEHHVGCLREFGLCDLQELPKDKWFCCQDCSNIFLVLQNLNSSGPEVIPAQVSAAIHTRHAAIGLTEESNNEIQWCILNGKSRLPQHLLLLSRAAAIFRECFDPIVATSGRDLIPVMVYGRNISGQEFNGMYCVVLIVKSIVVSAALLRIFGREVAELPLVATCKEYQGKGYFQALFSCIERLLSSMNVKHLVVPSAEEAEPMWTKRLSFRKPGNEQILKYTRDFQLTMFKGTSLLEKEIQ